METKQFEGPGFTCEIPTNWFITSSMQFQVMFIAPPGANGERANLAVAMSPVKADVDVHHVAEVARQTQEKEYAQYQVLEEQDFVGETGVYARRYRWYDPRNGVQLLQRQLFWITGKMLFTVTTTRTVVKGAEVFDSIFDQITASFKVVPPSAQF